MDEPKKKLRTIEDPFVALGPSGVAIRDRLKSLTGEDEKVLRLLGAHLGRLASLDLKTRCAHGLDHNSDAWAARKQGLTTESSSRWAGAITKATHDQWALSRRCQFAHIQSLEAGVRTLMHRLSQPIGEKGTKRVPGGYRSKGEWFHKSRRLATLEHRLDTARAERVAGVVHVVRGGRRLLGTRHHSADAELTEAEWRQRWEAERWFLAADGESGKRHGNETIRVSPDGEVSIKVPAPLADLANAKHGRYVLASKVAFRHRGADWRDRIEANRAVAYRIHLDVTRGRWYLTASWTIRPVKTVPLHTARTEGMVGVDTNADHFAAYRLDPHGNPVGNPRRFSYDLSGTADHRDAQVRHAISQLLHWVSRCGVKAIGLENLDFTAEKTREKHGRRKRFRQLISGIPTGKLKARLVSMAAEHGLSIVAVDPAYTSMWGDEHWRKPLTSNKRKMSRHDAASIAIGRRALGHPIRRRTAPPPQHQSDTAGYRTAQAGPVARGREETRPRIPGPRTRSVQPDAASTRATRAPKTVRDAPDLQAWVQDSLLLTDEERYRALMPSPLPDAAAPEPAADARRGRRGVVTALVAADVAFAYQQTAVLPVIPDIERRLHAPGAWGAWLLTGYLLVATVATPLIGRLADRYGRRRLLLTGLVVFLAGSVGACLAPDFAVLICFRALQGVGGAVFPLSLSLVRQEFPGERVGSTVGLLTGGFGLGTTLGFATSGALAAALSWRMVFAVGAVVVAVAIPMVAVLVPARPASSGGRVDLPGACLLGAALAALLVALTLAPQAIEGAEWILPAVLGTLVLPAGWLWWRREHAVATPLVGVRVLRSPTELWTNGVTLVIGYALFGAYYLVPQIVRDDQHGFGADTSLIGLYLLPSAVGQLLSGPAARRLQGSGSPRRPLAVGMAAMAAALTGFAVIRDQSVAGFLAAAFVLGCGAGLCISSSSTLVSLGTPRESASVATALNSTVRRVGGGIGGQVSAGVLIVAGAGTGAWVTAFALGAVLAAASVPLAARIPLRRPPAAGRGEPAPADAGW